jgi:hypothetical protein
MILIFTMYGGHLGALTVKKQIFPTSLHATEFTIFFTYYLFSLLSTSTKIVTLIKYPNQMKNPHFSNKL